jgi:glyoxylate reductase
MTIPHIFITRRIPTDKLAQLRPYCQVDLWDEELSPPPQALLEHVQGVEAILCLLTDRIDAEVMDAAGPQLKVISNCAVGYDNIRVAEATRRGIPVGNTPGVLTDTTADFAFALLMAAARRVVEGDAFTLAGKWKTWGLTQLLGQDVTGATLGIIGFGRIGRGMAKRAQGFDMHVLYFDPATQDDPYAAEIGAQRADLDSLLRQADFISVHTPLTEATYHLIGTKALAKMKPTAILINTARGPIVDPDALYRALKDGVICYAALDVTEPEPIPMDHPLLTLPNLIITPHIASASVKTRGKMIQMSIDNLLAGLRGEHLPNCVNPEVYISGAS